MKVAQVRQLDGADATQYQSVRLQALEQHPEAFSSDAEDFAQRSLDQIRERLANQDEAFALFGAFVGDELGGLIGVGRSQGRKVRHRAGIYQMYVAPAYRGRGIGRLLIQHALDYVRSMPGLEEVVLAVTVGNGPARHLYEAAGFTVSHREPRHIKLGDRYYDIDWMYLPLER